MAFSRYKRVLQLTAFAVAIFGILFSCISLNKKLYTSVLSTAVQNKAVVILDAGHGGIDGGASVNGVKESDINLSIAQKSRDFLTFMGYRVIMTRDGDYSIHDSAASTIRAQKRSDLKNRLDIMRSMPEAVCVSIHLNRFGQSYVHGAQVFYGPTAGSRELAQQIQDNIAVHLQTDNERKIKKADSALYILINNEITPAVMVECGFLSNPADAENLQNEDYQKMIAYLLGYSLIQYENNAASGG